MSTALLGIARDSADERVLAEQICRVCIEGLDIDGASMSLLTASMARETLWASDATANLLEELQFSLGEGPCMQAASSGRAVMISDLENSGEAEAWPAFAAAVVEQTLVRALVVVPLQWGVINLGVLDLYRAAPDGLSPEQSRDLIAAADLAALMMLELRTIRTIPTARMTAMRPGWTPRWAATRRSTRPPGWCWPSSTSTRPTRLPGYGHMPSPTNDYCSTSPPMWWPAS